MGTFALSNDFFMFSVEQNNCFIFSTSCDDARSSMRVQTGYSLIFVSKKIKKNKRQMPND